MKKVLSIIVLLLNIASIDAQIRHETFKNVFVTNAAFAGISGDEALKHIQQVTSDGSTISIDEQKSMINIKVHYPKKTDVLKIEDVSEDDNYTIYSCVGTENQGEASVLIYKNKDCIMVGFAKASAIFIFTDMDKREILGLY